MSVEVPHQRIRFACDVKQWASKFASTVTDVVTGQNLQIANGADLNIELMFSNGTLSDGTEVDFTDIDHVVVALMGTANPHSGTTYWSFSVANADIDNAATAANWTAGTAQQISLAVPSATNALNLALAPSQTYWMAIYGVTTDATPKQVPYAFFQVSIVDTGMPAPNPVLPSAFKAGSAVPFVCSDTQTRDVTLTQSPSGAWTVSVNQTGYAGGGLATYSLYCSDGYWRDISLVSNSGVWTLSVDQTGHS